MKVAGDFQGAVVLAGGGLTLGSLAVVGDFAGRLDARGDVGSVSVGRHLGGDITARGHIGTLSAGASPTCASTPTASAPWRRSATRQPGWPGT